MKRLLKILVALITLVLVAVISLLIFINPNDYKPEIEAEVKKVLNRELVIAGDLSWSLFPRLSIGTGEVAVKNPAGYNRDNLMKIGSVSASIAILPLLKGQVELGKLSLHGLRLNIITTKSGASNLDNIGPVNAGQAPTPITPSTQSETTGAEPAAMPESVRFAGLDIIDAQLEIQDLATAVTTLVKVEKISLGEFELGKATDLTIKMVMATAGVEGDLSIVGQLMLDKALAKLSLNELTLTSELSGEAIPSGKLNLKITSDISVDINGQKIAIDNIMLNANDIQLSGHAAIELAGKMKVRFSLLGNEWDLNPFMPPPSDDEEKIVEVASEPQVEPNLAFLNELDVLGDITIAGVKASGINLNEIKLKVVINNGVAKLAPLSVNLYQGNMLLNGQVAHAGGRNKHKMSMALTNVQILPLLKDVTDMELVAGSTNFNLTASGEGLTVDKIKQGLVGNGDFKILDGALLGMNIPQKIRNAKASLTGGETESQENSERTDFTALTGTFSIKDGIANNTSLDMSAPFLRLKGNGTADIIKSLLDYHLKVVLVNSSQGQGGKERSDLAGLTIPLKVTGAFDDPKFGLDTGGALSAKLDQAKAKLKGQADKLKAQAKQKADAEKAKAKQKLKDKLKDKLGGFF
ncbi:MAG: AsmA family protein [Psychrobium sp.]|nr:AsmA family protein [Psychrobium sp.]